MACSVTVDDGTWGLVRASSNKPELVVVVESPVSEARLRAMFEAVDARLAREPGGRRLQPDDLMDDTSALAHVLPDVLEPGLRIVFCGTAAGHVSARRGAYYAHPQNRFWPALHAIGLTPRRLEPEDYPESPAMGPGADRPRQARERHGSRPARGRARGRGLRGASAAKIEAAAPDLARVHEPRRRAPIPQARRSLRRAGGADRREPESGSCPSPSPTAALELERQPALVAQARRGGGRRAPRGTSPW